MTNTQDSIFLKLANNETINLQILIKTIYADSIESLSKYVQNEMSPETQQLLETKFQPSKVLLEVLRETPEVSEEELNEEFLSFKMLIRQYMFNLFSNSLTVLTFNSEESSIVTLSLVMDMSNTIDEYCNKVFPTAFVARVESLNSATYIFSPIDLLNAFTQHPDITKYIQEQEEYIQATTTIAT